MIYGKRRTIGMGDFVPVSATLCQLLTGEGRLGRSPARHLISHPSIKSTRPVCLNLRGGESPVRRRGQWCSARSESVQLQAARAVLKELMAVREHVDLEERMVEIERQLPGAKTDVP